MMNSTHQEDSFCLVSVGAATPALCSAARAYSHGGSELHRNCFHGHVVQYCQVGEDQDGVCAAVAQSSARNTSRRRYGTPERHIKIGWIHFLLFFFLQIL